MSDSELFVQNYTKFRKKAITSLLNIPDLLNVVKDWDSYIRGVSKAWSTWYPRYEYNNLSFKDCYPESRDREKAYKSSQNIKSGFYRTLEKLCMLLLDVRSEEEYMSGHIPQSVNIPLDKISNIQNVVKKLDSAIFVYYLRGTRSRRAAGIWK